MAAAPTVQISRNGSTRFLDKTDRATPPAARAASRKPVRSRRLRLAPRAPHRFAADVRPASATPSLALAQCCQNHPSADRACADNPAQSAPAAVRNAAAPDGQAAATTAHTGCTTRTPHRKTTPALGYQRCRERAVRSSWETVGATYHRPTPRRAQKKSPGDQPDSVLCRSLFGAIRSTF